MMRVSKEDIQKANNKGSRDAELETINGFPTVVKIHKNKKRYDRTKKHKGLE